MAQRRPDTTPAIGLELRANASDGPHECRVGELGLRSIVVGRARDAHQLASLGDAKPVGPVITHVGPLLGRSALAGLPGRPARQARTRAGGTATAYRRLNPTIPRGAATVRSTPSWYNPDADQIPADVSSFNALTLKIHLSSKGALPNFLTTLLGSIAPNRAKILSRVIPRW